MAFWLFVVAIMVLVGVMLARGMRMAILTSNTRAAAADSMREAQFAEIERGLAGGTLDAESAATMRSEADRAHSRIVRRGEDGDFSRGPWIGAASIVGLSALVAVALYAYTGAPKLRDLPLTERAEMMRPSQERALEILAEENSLPVAEPIDTQTAELVDQLRTAIADRGDDPEGWRLLARTLYGIGDFVGAAEAQESFIKKVDTPEAQDIALAAETKILALNGYVSPEAEANIRAALRVDPQNMLATFYMAITMRQEGANEQALQVLQTLRQRQIDNPDWVSEIDRQIASLEELRGPTAEDIENAGDMNDEDRTAMIEGMVEGLQSRLAEQGGTPAQWAQLIRALGVLGRNEQAAAILAEARSKFPNDPTIHAIVEELP